MVSNNKQEEEKIPEPQEEILGEEVGTGEGAFQEGKEKKSSSIPPDPKWNHGIPLMIGKMVFKSPPTSLLPSGKEKSEASERAETFYSNTAPVLEIISFHECLGAIGDLSPTTRLMIGVGVIGVNLVLLMPKKEKGKKGGKKPKEESE